MSLAQRTGPQATGAHDAAVVPWDIEWAAEMASDALRYLNRNFPECAGTRVLDEYHEAAVRGDKDDYLEALRNYCRAGRNEALRIRQQRKQPMKGRTA